MGLCGSTVHLGAIVGGPAAAARHPHIAPHGRHGRTGYDPTRRHVRARVTTQCTAYMLPSAPTVPPATPPSPWPSSPRSLSFRSSRSFGTLAVHTAYKWPLFLPTAIGPHFAHCPHLLVDNLANLCNGVSQMATEPRVLDAVRSMLAQPERPNDGLGVLGPRVLAELREQERAVREALTAQPKFNPVQGGL